MKSILLIIACIVIIILAISKCKNIQQNKTSKPKARHSLVKKAYSVLPADENIWPVCTY